MHRGSPLLSWALFVVWVRHFGPLTQLLQVVLLVWLRIQDMVGHFATFNQKVLAPWRLLALSNGKKRSSVQSFFMSLRLGCFPIKYKFLRQR